MRPPAIAARYLSPIPLGIVTGGFWPLGLTRILAEEVRLEEPVLSPRGEAAWVRPGDEVAFFSAFSGG